MNAKLQEDEWASAETTNAQLIAILTHESSGNEHQLGNDNKGATLIMRGLSMANRTLIIISLQHFHEARSGVPKYGHDRAWIYVGS